MSSKLGKLEALLGYKFKDMTLLERSVTHRSWAYENAGPDVETRIHEIENESLEFVGDSVVGLFVAEQLLKRHPQASEGDLTLMKHKLVSGPALASIAEELGLGEYIRLGKGEVKGGRKKQSLLTNTFEAIVGAVFVDGGYIETRAVLMRVFGQRLRQVTPEESVDFKSRLQTELQAQKLRTAEYHLINAEGPPHSRTFYVEVSWEGGTAKGEGTTKKAAEMMAAKGALEQMSKSNGDAGETRAAADDVR
jgi:ribonuclease-3